MTRKQQETLIVARVRDDVRRFGLLRPNTVYWLNRLGLYVDFDLAQVIRRRPASGGLPQ